MNIHDLIARRACKTTIPPVSLPEALQDKRLDRAGICHPLVSIIVTSFNYGPYIEDCLRSVARQTYENWECIVVDDVSTDDTMERVRAFIDSPEAGDRFRLLARELNGGQMEAFRDGLAVASGSFVVMLDADDVLLDDFLKAHMRAHLTVATVAFTSSNQYQINGPGEIIGGQHMDHQSKGYYRLVSNTSFQHGFWVWATSSSMVYRRSTVDLIMLPDGTIFRICADYYIAHFSHLIGDSLLIPTIHGCYRRHGANNFGSNPVLGNINSVGSQEKHPPHELFRKTMVQHLLNNYEQFRSIYLGPGLTNLLLRMVTPGELPGLMRSHPDIFPRPLRYYLWLAAKREWAKRCTPVSEKFKIIPNPMTAKKNAS